MVVTRFIPRHNSVAQDWNISLFPFLLTSITSFVRCLLPFDRVFHAWTITLLVSYNGIVIYLLSTCVVICQNFRRPEEPLT
jgi:hypothetical protein